MKKPINKGYMIESAMKKWFKGESHRLDCVDFQTKTSLYEVKACNLLNKCVNGNDKRKYTGAKPHKKIESFQLGRFSIKNENHKKLLETATSENKAPKYIFAVVIENQRIWKVKSWEEVNVFMGSDSRDTKIKIKDIFSEMI